MAIYAILLTDDDSWPKKFRVTLHPIVPSLGCRLITEEDFNPDPGSRGSSALDSEGGNRK